VGAVVAGLVGSSCQMSSRRSCSVTLVTSLRR
jgi:hypothetical protein